MVMIALLPVLAAAGTWLSRSPALVRIPREPTAESAAPRFSAGSPTGRSSPLPTQAAVAQPGAEAEWQATTRDLHGIVAGAGPEARISIAWWEVDRPGQHRYSLHGGDRLFAASTYKLPLLVETGRRVSTGRVSWNDTICYRPEDAEDSSFYEDYEGRCPTRQQLAERTGRYSDNTAAHMLTRDLGGPAALNAAARRMGATRPEFFTPNITSADDLGNILESLAAGRALTTSVRTALEAILSRTAFERGIPAGVPAPGRVIHKVGAYGSTINDAALVIGAARGNYVLVVLTDRVPGGEEAAWPLIKRISARVWDYERGR